MQVHKVQYHKYYCKYSEYSTVESTLRGLNKIRREFSDFITAVRLVYY